MLSVYSYLSNILQQKEHIYNRLQNYSIFTRQLLKITYLQSQIEGNWAFLHNFVAKFENKLME